MSSQFVQGNCTWRELYEAAIHETDQPQLAERIAQAEWAIIVRGHSLLDQRESGAQERRELNTALDALRILKNYSRRTRAA
jgi:hypothetical protein